MEKETPNTKRLVIELPSALHQKIKEQALWRHITVRKYVLQAILMRMKNDEQYL